MNQFKKRYGEIKKNFQDDTVLVAVTKYYPTYVILDCLEAGIYNIAESRVQEAERKLKELKTNPDYSAIYSKFVDDVAWHFIGHLQRNKVGQVVANFNLIQSLDSLRLAHAIDKEASKQNKVMDCLLQINIGAEEQKYGFSLTELDKVVVEISTLKNIKIKGLMAMAPLYEDPELTRPYFHKMKEVFERLKHNKYANIEMEILSMGMSADYLIALDEGANMLRLGSILLKDM